MMKRAALAILLFTLATGAHAQQTFTLSLQESRSFQMMGASAAWAIDASIVEVSASNGTVSLFARGAGTTKIVVVSITGQNTFDVVVQPRVSIAPATQKKASSGVAEARYSSAARETQIAATTTQETKTRRVEANVRLVNTGDAQGARARNSIASASYRIFTRNRELTFFDRDVDHSPLTLSHTPIRGIHYLDDHWRLHAGVTAYAMYQSFFIPVDQQFVAGGGYAFRTSARSTVTPSVIAYRGEGTVLSVLYDYARSDRLGIRAELGYSHGLGGAAQVDYDSTHDRVRADVRYRAEDFAVTAGTPRGFFSDASWTHDYGRNSTVATSFAATDFLDTRVISATTDVDHRLNDRVTLMGGASWGSFDGAQSITIPIGARYDFAHAGVSALYRYAQSDANEGGHGFRLAGRATLGRLYASAYVDRQQNAPSLDLIFTERPDLALALEELGISATSPADVARALRDNAVLAELGFIEGVTVDFAPMRTQFGLELSLLGASEARQRLRFRLLHNVIEGVSSRSATTIASLSWSRRLTASSDVFLSYSYWRTERRGAETRTQPFVEVGIRQQFNGIPSFGSGTIRGNVFADEDLDGVSDGNGNGVAAVIEVDGAKSERTDADGTFAVSGLSKGSHRVVARIPDRPDAYFTTPSKVEAKTGEKIAFGVATTPARLHGRVLSDAGDGIAGVRVIVTRGQRSIAATTESDGAFAINAPPGEWQVAIVAESVPVGYSLSGADARNVMLDKAKPASIAFALNANRSISGSGALANAAIEVRPLGKTIHADAQGRFTLRSLAPGEVTLVAGGVEKRVLIPSAPGSVPVSLDRNAPSAVASVASASHETPVDPNADWMVQIGVYRVPDNAVRVAAQVRATGVDATVRASGTLTVVHSGPYTSRESAEVAAAKLTRAGIEALVEKRPK